MQVEFWFWEIMDLTRLSECDVRIKYRSAAQLGRPTFHARCQSRRTRSLRSFYCCALSWCYKYILGSKQWLQIEHAIWYSEKGLTFCYFCYGSTFHQYLLLVCIFRSILLYYWMRFIIVTQNYKGIDMSIYDSIRLLTDMIIVIDIIFNWHVRGRRGGRQPNIAQHSCADSPETCE